MAAARWRRDVGAQGRGARRRGGVFLSLPVAHRARAAELHGAFQGWQDRCLGAGAKSGAGHETCLQDAWRSRKGCPRAHDARRRRFRTSPAKRLHGGSRVDFTQGRRAREAVVESSRRHAARLLSSRGLPLFQGRPRRQGRAGRAHRSFRDLRQGWQARQFIGDHARHGVSRATRAASRLWSIRHRLRHPHGADAGAALQRAGLRVPVLHR